MSIYLTGSSGFVGQNLVSFLGDQVSIVKYSRGSNINILEEIVIHLAGKAHDLKKTSNSSEYYQVNTEFTKVVFDAFLTSEAKVFITLSSVKAVADEVVGQLTEDHIPNPITHYGKSKLLAEQYILSQEIPVGKRVYILRPCMIHGPGNKGNLNLLYNFVSKGIPWPLGSFDNKRSFCSIDNLNFIIKELLEHDDIPSGVYNVADDIALSTNELIQLIAESIGQKAKIMNINKIFIIAMSKIGDVLKLSFNTDRLNKLSQNYIISNNKLKLRLSRSLPLDSKEGIIKTLKSFSLKV